MPEVKPEIQTIAKIKVVGVGGGGGSAINRMVQAGVKAGRIALGKDPIVDKWVFSTNGVATAGRLKIPTIGFGPSNEVYAHTVKENMPVSDLLKAAVFYAAIPQYL